MKKSSLKKFSRTSGLFWMLVLSVVMMALLVNQPAFAQGLTITYNVTPDAVIEKTEIRIGTIELFTDPVVWVNVTVKNLGKSKMGFEPIVQVDDGQPVAGGAMGLMIDPGKSKTLKSWVPVKSRSLPKKIDLTLKPTTWK